MGEVTPAGPQLCSTVVRLLFCPRFLSLKRKGPIGIRQSIATQLVLVLRR
jgi:hypothetical protein